MPTILSDPGCLQQPPSCDLNVAIRDRSETLTFHNYAF